MPRSLKKGAFLAPYLQPQHVQKKIAQGKPLRIWSRASVITPDFIGMSVEIHNGRKFMPLFVTEDMVGHKFGEFAPTRSFRGHKTKK